MKRRENQLILLNEQPTAFLNGVSPVNDATLLTALIGVGREY